MLLPTLLRAIWPIVIVGVVLMIATIIVNIVLFGEEGGGEGSWKNPPILARVMLGAAPFLYAMLCAALFSYAARHDRGVAADLRANGVAAEATVTAVHDLGIDVSTASMLALQLRVTPPGAEPFEAELHVQPSRLVLYTYLPGRKLRVRFDPKDRSRITVDE